MADPARVGLQLQTLPTPPLGSWPSSHHMYPQTLTPQAGSPTVGPPSWSLPPTPASAPPLVGRVYFLLPDTPGRAARRARTEDSHPGPLSGEPHPRLRGRWDSGRSTCKEEALQPVPPVPCGPCACGVGRLLSTEFWSSCVPPRFSGTPSDGASGCGHSVLGWRARGHGG